MNSLNAAEKLLLLFKQEKGQLVAKLACAVRPEKLFIELLQRGCVNFVFECFPIMVICDLFSTFFHQPVELVCKCVNRGIHVFIMRFSK